MKGEREEEEEEAQPELRDNASVRAWLRRTTP
jgi:hypothetical protein